MRGVGTEDDVRLPIPHASIDQPEGAGSLGLGQSHSQEPAEELAFLSDTSTWLLERPYPQTKHHKQTTLRDPPCSWQQSGDLSFTPDGHRKTNCSFLLWV